MIKQVNKLNRQLIVILLTFSCIIPAYSASLQSHAGIAAAVKEFVTQQNVPLKNIKVKITSLNKQLRLPQCYQPLVVDMAAGTKLIGHTSLSVSCESAQMWKIHVAAHIDGTVDVLVARHPLPRGTLIQESDLKFVSRRYSQLHRGYYGNAKLAVNKETKRNIKAGQVITPAVLSTQKLVLRGQHITIIAQNGSLNIRVKGKAMMDGQKGQTIKVTNLKTKKLIYARVVSDGMVKINF